MIKEIEKVSYKNRNLILGLLFDGIGMVSFSIPLLGEFSDVIWAPIAGFLMTWMYKGNIGKIAGIITFLEEIIPFVLIIVPICLALGYDSIIGVAIPLVGAHVGFASAYLNPFNVGIAQGIADVPLFSGIGYRIICWLISTFVAIGFLL